MRASYKVYKQTKKTACELDEQKTPERLKLGIFIGILTEGRSD
jgi:hypothetical protein